MKASVAICTYNRPEETKRLLASLSKQNCTDFEVVVICQGNEGDLKNIRESAKADYPLKFFYEPFPNLPHARNIALKESSGEIVIFLDDDAVPDISFVRTHLDNYSDSNIAIVGGRILGEKEENIPDAKVGKVRRFDGYHYAGFHKNLRREVMHVRGVNMSVRRQLALQLGAFDERFEGTAYYEDMDLCLRALKNGYKVIFDPAPIVQHFVATTGGCRVKSRREVIYWLYRNHTLLFLKNFNKLFFPILASENLVRAIRRSLLWSDFGVIINAFKGMRDGWGVFLSNS